MTASVIIDCFPECLPRYRGDYTIVAVDVIRTSTTLLTAAALGRRCFPVPSIEAAVEQAERLPNALVGGELGGSVPYGFEIDNSPAALVGRSDIERPLVLLSTAGTRVICNTEPGQVVYAACLRNWSAQAAHLVDRHPKVAVIGAGARGEFRQEDELGCAWIAQRLAEAGYRPETSATTDAIERWRDAPVSSVADGPSADFLRTTGRDADLDFVVEHVDDIDAVLRLEGAEFALEHATAAPPAAGLSA